jgi:polar amino acid transport system permease protein
MTWDWTYVQKILPDLLIGAWYTFLVTLASSLIALIGGLMIAIFDATTGRLGHMIVRVVLEFFRGVPILVLLYFGFYVLPEAGITLSGMALGIGVLGLVYAAFCSEVYRGSLLTIPQGIRDACVALGLSPSVAWRKVLIPLAVSRSAPALLNYVLVLFRQSSFLFAIGVPVLLGQAQVSGYQSFRYLEPFTLAGLFYLALNLPFVYLLNKYKAGNA